MIKYESFMKKRENPKEIIENYVNEFNNLLCDLVDDLQTKSYDVGQREISNLCDRFEKELWYFWARNYYKDEIFQFALMHPEEAQDECEIRAFLDSLNTMDTVEETVWDITELNDDECQKIDDYNNYAEEMEEEMKDASRPFSVSLRDFATLKEFYDYYKDDNYGDGAGTYSPACGMSQSDRDIRVQPIKKSRQKRYHIYPKRKDPNQIKSMDDFYDYFRDDNETDDGPDLEF